MIGTDDGRPPRTAKAAMLHRGHAAGLPVPAGVLVRDGERAPFSLAARLPGPLVVRSAFDGEDGTTTSAAGRYTSVLDVPTDAGDTAAGPLVDAVARVRASADDAVAIADVLVMTQVTASHAGVAVLEPAHLDDLVEHVCGLADGLVGGRDQGVALTLPRADRHEHPGHTSPPWHRRLAALLHDVRRAFGPSPAAGWDVEWADDGETCWLVQVRPLLRPTMRNEVLTLANHAEILPDLPSELMTSLIVASSPSVLSWYTTLDPRLPTTRDLVVERAGRPLLNHSPPRRPADVGAADGAAGRQRRRRRQGCVRGVAAAAAGQHPRAAADGSPSGNGGRGRAPARIGLVAGRPRPRRGDGLAAGHRR